jgi:DNA-binding beta-propeller fold protein YncE
MRVRILICVLVLLSLSAHVGARTRRGKTTPSSTDLVWPLPPDPPRIRYLEALHGSTDLAKKRGAWKRFVLGPETDPGITLVKPYDVVTDVLGRVYVSDTGLGAVLIFDHEAKEIRTLGAQGRGRLVTPVGLALDGQGRLFVADVSLDTVFCYDEREEVVLALGRKEGMRNPAGLAIDKQRHRLYVADSHLHQILIYSTEGVFLDRWGSRGSDAGQFNFPTNVTLDAQGNVYVVDTGNFRVQIFDPEGGISTTFGEAGDSLGSFHRPKGIGVDSQGHVYVADAAFNNFQIFDRQGRLLLFVGATGHEAGTFWLPAGLHIDGRDRIFVADQINRRVQVFQFLAE